MLFFQKIVCAMIVFIAYCQLGYYSPFGLITAVIAYFAEMRRLKGSVLMATQYGIPVGTLMCSRDEGYLPVDLAFPNEMQNIREKYRGRIGYFGKFAVIPSLQGQLTGKKILLEAVTKWSFETDASLIVMMVHPKHVQIWSRYGAQTLATTQGTKGLEKAPAVLMMIDFNLSPKVQSYRNEYLRLLAQDQHADIVGVMLATI